MTDDKGTDQPQEQPADEQDVEGHNMWIDPGSSRDMAHSRNKEIERDARERNRAKEAKRS